MLVVRLLRRRRATPSRNCSKWCLIRIRTSRGARAASAGPAPAPPSRFRAGSLDAGDLSRRSDRGATTPPLYHYQLIRSKSPARRSSSLGVGFSASEMALTLITLSFLVSAVRVPNTKLATARSTKVSLVQLCQAAHEHFLGGEDAAALEDLVNDLKGTPRRQRRPPLIVDSWDCS